MIVESLDIRRFGKLSDFKVTFDRGFNLIEGPAESGKTTLAAFLAYMLYGFPSEDGAAFSERAHRLSWEGGVAAGSMVFSAGSFRYRVERTGERTEQGWRDTYALLNLDTGLPEQGALSPGERFLGVPYESFLDTAFLSDVRRGGPSAKNTAEAIENILFSGEELISSASAVRALSEAAKELCSADGKSGAVAVLEKERDLLKEQLEEATQRERLHYEREEELFVTRRKMDEARAEANKFAKLETNYYNAMMIDDYDRLHALEDQSDGRVAVLRAHADRYRAGEFLPDRAYVSRLIEAKAETSSAAKEAEEAKEALSLLPEGRATVSEEEAALFDRVSRAAKEEDLRQEERVLLKKERLSLGLSAVLCAVFLTFAVLLFRAVVLDGPAPFFGALGILSLGGGVLFLVEGLRTRNHLLALYATIDAVKRSDFLANLGRAAEVRIRISHADAERERGLLRLSRAKERLALVEKGLSDTLSLWGVTLNTEDAEEQVARTLARAEEYLSENERLTAEHKAAEAEVRALREKLEGQNEVAVRARVAPDDRKRYRNQNAEDLRRGVLLYNERFESLSATERALMGALAEEEKTEPPAAIAERILAIETRIALLRERAELIAMAKAAIEGGADRLRLEISPRLSFDACRLLYEMTDGKYSDVTVGESFAMTYDDGEGAHLADCLSHSTEDLVYYALRLSLLNLMYRELPPVCFDGCTARQDDERALSFLRAVRTLTEEGKQCFFFSSGSRERELVKSVFSSYRHVKMPS